MVEKESLNTEQISECPQRTNTPNEIFDEAERQAKSRKLAQEREIAREEAWERVEAGKELLNNETTSPESASKQPDNETINPEPVPQQTNETQVKKNKEWEKAKEDKEDKIEKLVRENDVKWILKYLWLDKNIINIWEQIKTRDFIGQNLLNELEAITYPKDILKDISEDKDDFKFLEHETDTISETQNEYIKLYHKLMKIKEWEDDWPGYIFMNLLKKVFKELRKLKNTNKVFGYLYKNLMCKKITKDIVELKHALETKRKDMGKYLKKYHEYEKWEYVNFPNWINFQIWKWPEKIPWKDWKDIEIWDNEFYIKTHIEVNRENKETRYIEYVKSLITARKLFEKKYWKIKYCKRCTRLANREFIKEYEKERKKRKEKDWIKYEKSNRLKVLEQTENAVISYRHERYGKSPIRFINKDKDKHLFEFAQKSNNFCEAEMWLDIDKLEYQK